MIELDRVFQNVGFRDVRGGNFRFRLGKPCVGFRTNLRDDSGTPTKEILLIAVGHGNQIPIREELAQHSSLRPLVSVRRDSARSSHETGKLNSSYTIHVVYVVTHARLLQTLLLVSLQNTSERILHDSIIPQCFIDCIKFFIIDRDILRIMNKPFKLSEECHYLLAYEAYCDFV